MNTTKGYIRIEDDERKRKKFRFSLMYKTNFRLGICEQLRFICDSVLELPDSPLREKILEQLIDALIMGKKIVDRLSWYAKTYPNDKGHKGKNIVSLSNNKKRFLMRRLRVCE
jgi:hypothetical protein